MYQFATRLLYLSIISSDNQNRNGVIDCLLVYDKSSDYHCSLLSEMDSAELERNIFPNSLVIPLFYTDLLWVTISFDVIVNHSSYFIRSRIKNIIRWRIYLYFVINWHGTIKCDLIITIMLIIHLTFDERIFALEYLYFEQTLILQ